MAITLEKNRERWFNQIFDEKPLLKGIAGFQGAPIVG